MNLSGEIGLAKNRLNCLRTDLLQGKSDAETLRELDQAVSNLDLLVGDLQNAVMKTRMQPVGRLFQKYPRVARDLARQLGKQVNLELSGEDTELDKTMIEDLNDPLIHLVRNAVDHGIETAEERAAQRKPAPASCGSVAQQIGDHIIIEVSDDGRGMRPDVLRRKAVEKGLLEADVAANMDDQEALRLVFLPGFSTKDAISSVSGRGVGMDVVKTNIQKLNGRIDIRSVIGEGTTFTIHLPLTLAILPVLVIKLGEQPFAVPLSLVREIIPINPDEVQEVSGRATMMIRNEVLPIRSLAGMIGWPVDKPPAFGVLDAVLAALVRAGSGRLRRSRRCRHQAARGHQAQGRCGRHSVRRWLGRPRARHGAIAGRASSRNAAGPVQARGVKRSSASRLRITRSTSMADSPLLVRLPVLNRKQEIVGYDLRLSAATASTLKEHGLLRLLSGSSDQENFFLRLPNRFALTDVGQLESEKSTAESSGRVVIEVNPSAQPGDTLVPQARKWKAAGYGICLQRPYDAQVSPETLDLASYFTIDGAELSGNLEKTCNRLRRHSAKQIAINVATPQGFQDGYHAGCDFFRGYFFTTPQPAKSQAINPSYTTIVSVMKLVQDNAPVAKIEEALKRDATLAYKLLRYINSAGFGLSCEIQSFRHAVAVLGYKNLYRWLALLMVTAARDTASSALVTTAITRGRLAELLGGSMFDSQERDNLFIVGAFSLLEAILKMPLEEVIEQIPLPEPVLDAVLRREGPYGPILSVVEATETLDQASSRAQAAEISELLSMTPAQLNRAQIDALAWAEGLVR